MRRNFNRGKGRTKKRIPQRSANYRNQGKGNFGRNRGKHWDKVLSGA